MCPGGQIIKRPAQDESRKKKRTVELAKTAKYLNVSSVLVGHFKPHEAFTQLGQKEMEF